MQLNAKLTLSHSFAVRWYRLDRYHWHALGLCEGRAVGLRDDVEGVLASFIAAVLFVLSLSRNASHY